MNPTGEMNEASWSWRPVAFSLHAADFTFPSCDEYELVLAVSQRYR